MQRIWNRRQSLRCSLSPTLSTNGAAVGDGSPASAGWDRYKWDRGLQAVCRARGMAPLRRRDSWGSSSRSASAQSSLAQHPPALRARRRQGTQLVTAPAFAPTLTLSVSGIAQEAPTIIVSPGYVSRQDYSIRIIAFVLAGRAQRRIRHQTASCRAALQHNVPHRRRWDRHFST
jgi:hypothetical protein